MKNNTNRRNLKFNNNGVKMGIHKFRKFVTLESNNHDLSVIKTPKQDNLSAQYLNDTINNQDS